jgi:phosphopantetheinyl transferase
MMRESLIAEILDKDLDQERWPRFFKIEGPLSLVVLSLANLHGEERAEVWLCPTEKSRLAEFSYARRRREWLGGRMAAKYAFLSLVGKGYGPEFGRWSAWEVAAGENGRPYIRDAGSLRAAIIDVSISHSHDWAAAMAVNNGHCGVDIQKITPQVLKVKERFMDAAEHGILAQVCGRRQESSQLTMLWAAKEALKKASGTKKMPGFLDMKLKRAVQQEGGSVDAFVELTFRLTGGDAVRNGDAECAVAAFFHETEYVIAFTVQENMG